MWLVVGLGNPEKTYENTRHNIGFRVLDALNLSFQEDRQFRALLAKKDGVLYCKPLTYMNNSGTSVAAIMHYFHIPLDHVVAIYDDKEIPFGTLRLRSEGSDGGHNGIKSLITQCGGNAFPRIRIGVGPTPEHIDAADFVLGRFTQHEETSLPKIIIAAHTTLIDILRDGLSKQTHRDVQIITNATNPQSAK